MFHGEGRLCQVQMVHVAKREDVGSCHESVTHSPEDEGLKTGRWNWVYSFKGLAFWTQFGSGPRSWISKFEQLLLRPSLPKQGGKDASEESKIWVQILALKLANWMPLTSHLTFGVLGFLICKKGIIIGLTCWVVVRIKWDSANRTLSIVFTHSRCLINNSYHPCHHHHCCLHHHHHF